MKNLKKLAVSACGSCILSMLFMYSPSRLSAERVPICDRHMQLEGAAQPLISTSAAGLFKPPCNAGPMLARPAMVQRYKPKASSLPKPSAKARDALHSMASISCAKPKCDTGYMAPNAWAMPPYWAASRLQQSRSFQKRRMDRLYSKAPSVKSPTS